MSSYDNPIVEKLIKWGGFALIVSGICVAVGLSGFVPMLVVKIGAVVFGAGLALLGKGLLGLASA